MDLQSLSLPDWLPWWGVAAVLVPVAFWLALFLLMPFSTFGLRGRLRELELRTDALHEEIRSMTLRLPERGLDPYDDMPPMAQPPIPPAAHRTAREAAPRAGFGDPVADRMLAYMRDKAQEELQRAEQPRAEQHRATRPRAEPRFIPRPPDQTAREPDPPPPPPPSGPPRLPGRFGRRGPESGA